MKRTEVYRCIICSMGKKHQFAAAARTKFQDHKIIHTIHPINCHVITCII